MELSKFSNIALIRVYGKLLVEMRERKLIRSKNVTGDLGETCFIPFICGTLSLFIAKMSNAAAQRPIHSTLFR